MGGSGGAGRPRAMAASFSRLGAASACLWTASHSAAQALDLPSGVSAELAEVLIEEIGAESWLRFRFVAPAIDISRPGAPGFGVLEQDFPFLCSNLALPYLRDHEIDADRIVISIADRMVEFGVTDPQATQYFELFRRGDDGCVWEAF